jgi:hypothetical protein
MGKSQVSNNKFLDMFSSILEMSEDNPNVSTHAAGPHTLVMHFESITITADKVYFAAPAASDTPAIQGKTKP